MINPSSNLLELEPQHSLTLSPGLLIFGAVLALVALCAVPYGAVEPWWEAAFECLAFLLGALWIVEVSFAGDWRRCGVSLLLLPLIAIILFAFLQIIPLDVINRNGIAGHMLSADPFETERFIYKALALVLVMVLLNRYAANHKRLRTLVTFVILIGVLSALFGIIRQVMQRDAEGFVLPFLMPKQGYAQFINRNHFAFLMEMTLGLILGLIIGGGAKRQHLLIYITALLLVSVTLVLSNSRGGVLALLCQLMFIVMFAGAARSARETRREENNSRSRWLNKKTTYVLRLFIGASLLAVVIVGVVWLGGEPLAERFASLRSDNASAESEASPSNDGGLRIDNWRATWQLIKAHPIAGVGFGGYWVAITRYHAASGTLTPQQAHNDYLELLASGGLVGAVLGIWFCVILIKRARAQLMSADTYRRAACFGALTGLFGVAIHSTVDFGLHITINALVCVMLIVIATTTIRTTN